MLLREPDYVISLIRQALAAGHRAGLGGPDGSWG
jgi:hypothetical protein